jgi:hypothetical protein
MPGMTSGRGKDRGDIELIILYQRNSLGLRLRAATCHALRRGTALVTGRKAGADEPYERIVHVRVCGGRRGQPRLLPGSEPRDYVSVACRASRARGR